MKVSLVVTDGHLDGIDIVVLVSLFVAFTLRQSGMVRHWWKRRGESRWRVRAAINGVGAITTGVDVGDQLGVLLPLLLVQLRLQVGELVGERDLFLDRCRFLQPRFGDALELPDDLNVIRRAGCQPCLRLRQLQRG